ncbi:MAG: hypothetical protein GY817_03490 [bacterium]|nr:hypothetical protein [bacterium]
MLFFLQVITIFTYFWFGFFITKFIASSIIISRLKGDISVFEKVSNNYKSSIIRFNSKVFKLKFKENFIPYVYLLIVNFIGLISYFMTKTPIMWIFFMFLLYYFPEFILNTIQKRRIAKIEKQLVSALIFLGNALKAGLDIVQGFELAVDSIDEPISEEFDQILQEYHLGVPLEEALSGFRDRVESIYVETFVTSIIIQRESGGDVTKIIEQIIHTVRGSYRLQGKVKALTAQGRIQAIIVVSLPWVLGGLLLAIQPDFMLPMFRTTLGMILLSVLVILQFIGILVIRKVVTIEV